MKELRIPIRRNDIFFKITKTKQGNIKSEFDHYKFIELLNNLGFKLYKFDNINYDIIRIQNNIASQSSITEIKKAVSKWIKELDYIQNSTYDEVLAEIIKHNESLFSEKKIQNIDFVGNSELYDDNEWSFIPFKNVVIGINKDKMYSYYYDSIDGFVWQDQVIDHNIELIDIDNIDCDFKTFIYNVSGRDNKMFAQFVTIIGYLLHKYKDPGKPWSVLICEQNENPDDGGGSGKGIIVNAISRIINTVQENGKAWKATSDFAYQKVKPSTNLIAIQDIEKRFNLEPLYVGITDGLNINKKNKSEYFIPYSKSPKFCFTTNYTLELSKEHTRRRTKIMALSNHYNKSNTPKMEFGKNFFDEWDHEEWNKFYNFMIICLQAYLRESIIETQLPVTYSMKNIISNYGDMFAKWARFKFNSYEFEGKLTLDSSLMYDRWISQRALREDFIKSSDEDIKYSPERFSKALRSYLQSISVSFQERRVANGMEIYIDSPTLSVG
ncbi:hypothetical protein D3C71_343970 [compost metagenome]